LEVVAATSLVAVAVTVLAGYIVSSLQTRTRAEARRQAVIAAHNRCELFARGQIYTSTLTSMSPAASTTIVTQNPADLPGGFMVHRLSETISVGVAGPNSASILVHIEVDTQQSVATQVTALGLRFW